MDDREAGAFARTVGLEVAGPFRNNAVPFDGHLGDIIHRHELDRLFGFDGPGRHHHAVRPAGFDYGVDAVNSAGMKIWRADYRALGASR